MAQPYVTGPAHLFCGVGPGRTPLYLGTAEKAPTIDLQPGYTPYFNDLGGQTHPMDKVYQGEIAVVGADVTRWNEITYAAISDKALLIARGVNDPGEIGRLMVFEGAAYTLWVQFPYAAKPAFAAGLSGAMPAGYRFPAAFLETDSLPELGTKPRKLHLVWTCLRTFDPTFINAFGQGRFTLYDANMAGLPLID